MSVSPQFPNNPRFKPTQMYDLIVKIDVLKVKKVLYLQENVRSDFLNF